MSAPVTRLTVGLGCSGGGVRAPEHSLALARGVGGIFVGPATAKTLRACPPKPSSPKTETRMVEVTGYRIDLASRCAP